MRLSKFEQQIIKQSIYPFDKQAEIVLFGSRTNDAARGGDIDLLIISNKIKRHQLGEIRWQLWEKLGEQKIDLVLSDKQLLDTFARVAFEQGVKLS
ncbi:MAG: nucleotidyltransferase domain-containing protein [Candidatus Parabeggiatoa sp. nov. 1]|nr:MAG: nucleotidyltransferase domain-containing protein [Gammaproteobacteria bacterium]